MRIVGIDLSLTGTGLAELTTDPCRGVVNWTARTQVVLSSGKKDDDLEQRFNRQSALSVPIIDFVFGPKLCSSPIKLPDLVLIEGLFSSGQVGGAQIDRSGFWWRIVGSLICYGLTPVVVTPMQGKKFFTGNGSSDKGGMTMSAARLYPQWTPSTVKNTNDEADALALASIGACLLASVAEWPVPETEYRHKIVDDLNKKQLRGKKMITE